MKKPFFVKVAISLCLTVLLAATVLQGCVKENVVVPLELGKLSLVDMWEKLVDATGVQKGSVNLDSLQIHTDEDGNIDSLFLVFNGVNKKGKAEVFFVDINSKGELSWYFSEGNYTSVNRDPLNIFSEIDALGLSYLEPGDGGLSVRVDFLAGDVGYSNEYSDIYHLEKGTLKKLNEIVFHSRIPWCTIEVFKLSPPVTVDGTAITQATTAAGPVPSEERTSQIWFVSEDINKAEVVEYLEDETETTRDDFVSGIKNVLPESWEMELITQKGLMGHPHGLSEPLFRINFVDPIHQFEGPGGQACFPSLRLYFYDIQEKDAILETIEAEKIYSWDVPDYFYETAEYIVVTSPLYINGGYFSSEAVLLYKPLEKALKDYFDVTSGFNTPAKQAEDMLPLQIISITSPVVPRAEVTLVAQTIPGAECDLTIDYGPSGVSNLHYKIADGNGRVSWTWTALKFKGIWQVEVTASYDGRTGSQHSLFIVE